MSRDPNEYYDDRLADDLQYFYYVLVLREYHLKYPTVFYFKDRNELNKTKNILLSNCRNIKSMNVYESQGPLYPLPRYSPYGYKDYCTFKQNSNAKVVP